MDNTQVTQYFLDTSSARVQQMEHTLRRMDKQRDKREAVARIYRLLHAIGLRAAGLGFDQLAGFVLGMESMLDKVRRGELDADSGVVRQFLRGCEHIDLLLEHAAARNETAISSGSQLRHFMREFEAIGTVQALLRKAQRASVS